MSNQDQGLSIFDDDEPETGSTKDGSVATSADAVDAEKTQVLPAVTKDVTLPYFVVAG